ncbi:hypothetical protein QE429_001843 [Bacillus sp. SORGH_AS 510]|uniref:VrrA/YqfQ family protein n=1 Tax=Bacillus sp. SORGH_AS_0510 TaxID=3041771 RepID=UPI00277ED740|nr:VrrA/YqfQ family protein [Bacillus sp. SORGH_AS_0510]MDQ1145016.1 hypothetical protein [Bacillus sp. SORGH_AS_0510]
MQPRPRIPMQGGMGPGMYGGRNPMMGAGNNPFGGMMGPGGNPFGGGGPMMRPSANPLGRNPMMGAMGRQANGGGGLLSRILGRGNPAGGGAGGLMGAGGAGRAASGGAGGLLQSLSNPGGITNMLNNTQQVLRTAQSIGPMIQQYGPMVKNLPAMWRLYKGFKNASKSTDESTSEQNNQSISVTEEESSTKELTGNRRTGKTSTQKEQQKPVNTGNSQKPRGTSTPKMYI